jgi:hypothetical protein
MPMTRRRRAHGEKGAAAVEFALVLPLLLMLLFGIITFGLAYHEKLALANALREGSRFGATAPSGAGWSTDVVDHTKSVLFGTTDAADVDVCAKLLQADGTVVDASACSLPASEEPPTPADIAPGGCVVKVWGSQDAHLSIVMAAWDVQLTGRSVATYERTPCGGTP